MKLSQKTKSEKVSERLWGKTTYQESSECYSKVTWSKQTHMCFSHPEVNQALMNQARHFLEKGAKILKLEIFKEDTTKIEVEFKRTD